MAKVKNHIPYTDWMLAHPQSSSEQGTDDTSRYINAARIEAGHPHYDASVLGRVPSLSGFTLPVKNVNIYLTSPYSAILFPTDIIYWPKTLFC